MWWTVNDDPWQLKRLDQKCPHHGWVEVPIAALNACLYYAGRRNVPVPLREPIRRLRYSLRWQPDTVTVRAAMADVRLLAFWLSDNWCPWALFAPLDVLIALIDWHAHPITQREEAALRNYD
jgi:hypothetical protein